MRYEGLASRSSPNIFVHGIVSVMQPQLLTSDPDKERSIRGGSGGVGFACTRDESLNSLVDEERE